MEGSCAKISNEQLEYEKKIATENGLIQTGKSLALAEEAKKNEKIRYQKLLTIVRELDGFDGNDVLQLLKLRQFDKDLLTAKVESLIKYISSLKELNEILLKKIRKGKREISLLNDQVENMDEVIDSNLSLIREYQEKEKNELSKELNLYGSYVSKNKSLVTENKALKLRLDRMQSDIKYLFMVTILILVVNFYK